MRHQEQVAMSLYGMMRTGVSGMNAQANRLSSVADNIANSSTTGYKRSKTEFSRWSFRAPRHSYNSGGVNTTIRYAISQQGALQYTTSAPTSPSTATASSSSRTPTSHALSDPRRRFVPDGEGRARQRGRLLPDGLQLR
jgi:flagellar hook protein FlgE